MNEWAREWMNEEWMNEITASNDLKLNWYLYLLKVANYIFSNGVTAGILSFQGRSPSFSGVVKEDKKNSTVFLCVFMGLLFGGGVTVALFPFFPF